MSRFAGPALPPTSVMRSPSIATSPVKACLPVPSTMVPPRMTVSCMCVVSLNSRCARRDLRDGPVKGDRVESGGPMPGRWCDRRGAAVRRSQCCRAAARRPHRRSLVAPAMCRPACVAVSLLRSPVERRTTISAAFGIVMSARIRRCLRHVGGGRDLDQHQGFVHQPCAGRWSAGDAGVGDQAIVLGALGGDDAGVGDAPAWAYRRTNAPRSVAPLRLDGAVAGRRPAPSSPARRRAIARARRTDRPVPTRGTRRRSCGAASSAQWTCR